MSEPEVTPEKKDLDPKALAPFALLAVVAFAPMVVITALTVGLTGRFGRVRAATLGALTAVAAIVAFITVGAPDVVVIVQQAWDGWALITEDPLAAVVDVIQAGGVWAAILGAGLGAGVLGYLQRNVPREDLRMNLWSYVASRVLRARIRDGKTYLPGLTLGVEHDEPWKKTVIQPDTLNRHMLVTGTTGTGKSVGVMSLIHDAVKQGDPIVYIDLKGDIGVADQLAGLAQMYDRPFRHFDLHDATRPYVGPSELGGAAYNPAGEGDATRRKDLLTASYGSDVEFYSNQTEDYVQIAISVLLATGTMGNSALEAIAGVMNPSVLLDLAHTIDDSDIHKSRLIDNCERFIESYAKSREFVSSLKTFEVYLSLFRNSVVGPYITGDSDNLINFRQVDEGHEVVCFSLNSSLYSDLASRLATLVVQDLTTYAGERPYGKERPFRVVVDEFSAVGSNNIISLVSRGRSKGMNVTLATQTLADLDTVSPSFKGQIVDNVSCFAVFRNNSETDARVYAGLTGDIDADGGYGVWWQKFLRLETGQCVLIDKESKKVVKGSRDKRAMVTAVDVVMRKIVSVPEFEVPTPAITVTTVRTPVPVFDEVEDSREALDGPTTAVHSAVPDQAEQHTAEPVTASQEPVGERVVFGEVEDVVAALDTPVIPAAPVDSTEPVTVVTEPMVWSVAAWDDWDEPAVHSAVLDQAEQDTVEPVVVEELVTEPEPVVVEEPVAAPAPVSTPTVGAVTRPVREVSSRPVRRIRHTPHRPVD